MQSLKEKLDEHSKYMEQSAEKLGRLESENLTLRVKNQALNTISNKKRRFRVKIRSMPDLETPNSEAGATRLSPALDGDGAPHEKIGATQVHDIEDSDSELEPDQEAPEGAVAAISSATTYLEQMFSKNFDAIQSLVALLQEWLPQSKKEIPTLMRIPRLRMPRKFSFLNIKMYDGTGDSDDHIAQYRQRMLAVALSREAREATM